MYLQHFDNSIGHIPAINNPIDFLSRVSDDVVIVNNWNIFETNKYLTIENICKQQKECKNTKKIIEKLNTGV